MYDFNLSRLSHAAPFSAACQGTDAYLEVFKLGTEEELRKLLQKRAKKARRKAEYVPFPFPLSTSLIYFSIVLQACWFLSLSPAHFHLFSIIVGNSYTFTQEVSILLFILFEIVNIYIRFVLL